MSDPEEAVEQWQTLIEARVRAAEDRGAARVKRAVASVHYPDKEPWLHAAGLSLPEREICAWCRHPWPCRTAEAVDLAGVLEEREKIARAVKDLAESMPHRDLLRPVVMQIVGVIKRGGG